jgi:hypothetical protein
VTYRSRGDAARRQERPMMTIARGLARGARRRALCVAAVTAVVAALFASWAPEWPTAAAAPQQVPPGYRIESVVIDVNVGQNQEFEAAARCSGSQVAIGGGFLLPPDEIDLKTFALLSNGLDSSNTWTVKWVNRDAQFGTRLNRIVQVVCVDSLPPGVTWREVRAPDNPPGHYLPQYVTCQPDERIAGGGVMSNLSFNFVLSNAPHGNSSWLAAWANHNRTQNGTGVAQGLCAAPNFANIVSQNLGPRVLQGLQRVTVELRCPTGAVYNGGAELWSVLPNNEPPQLTILESGAVNTGTWRVQYANISGGTYTIQFFPYAVCFAN